MFKEYINAELK